MQQLVPGGQVLQILPAPAPSSPQVTGANTGATTVVRHPVAAARSKQPQLRPKPANNNSSPGPVQQSQVVK